MNDLATDIAALLSSKQMAQLAFELGKKAMP